MRNLSGRVNRLENADGGDDLPIKVIEQDLDDSTLYTDAEGNEYRRPFGELAEQYTLLVIEYRERSAEGSPYANGDGLIT